MKVQQIIQKLGKKSGLYLKRNAPTILTCVGAVGVVATTVTAVKSTPKALDILEKAKDEKGEDLTKLEIVKYAGPVYIPTIIFGVSTIACIFSANILNKRKQATLISAYALLDNSYKEYKKKVTELYGDKADFEVTNEIAKDNYEEDTVINSSDDIENQQLFYDMYSKRYFTTTNETVLSAEYAINKIMAQDSYATLNEFYDLLGIPNVEYGDTIGWSAAQLFEMHWTSWIDFNHKKTIFDDGLECYIIDFTEPLPDFEDY